MIIGIVILFFVLLIVSVPIYLAAGVSSGLMFWSDDRMITMAQRIIDDLNSTTLLAVPYFIIAAVFMQQGGAANALVEVFRVWLGKLPGGLAIVAVAACSVFAAMSGSSVATAMAMATLLVPTMLKNGYPETLAGGTLAAAGTLGILIPPSIAMLIYGIIAEVSIARLFLAGVVPGLLMALVFAAYIYHMSSKHGLVLSQLPPLRERLLVTVRSLPALSVPAIILGGLYGGYLTLTETAAVSAIVSIILSTVVYRGVTFRSIVSVMSTAVQAASAVMIIVATTLAFGHVITETGISDAVKNWFLERDIAAWQFLLLINILLLLAGTVLEVLSVMLILVPIIVPLLEPLGIDPIHFGIILVINMELALLSPPVGLNLSVVSKASGISLDRVWKGTVPFFVLMLLVLILVTYMPNLSLWLPNNMFG